MTTENKLEILQNIYNKFCEAREHGEINHLTWTPQNYQYTKFDIYYIKVNDTFIVFDELNSRYCIVENINSNCVSNDIIRVIRGDAGYEKDIIFSYKLKWYFYMTFGMFLFRPIFNLLWFKFNKKQILAKYETDEINEKIK